MSEKLTEFISYNPLPGKTRTFDTGATRDTDEGKNDYEGYLSPKVIKRFGEYMTKHRKQTDGKLRASDNWQKGIPRDQYIKSMMRHIIEIWDIHRDKSLSRHELQEALCALMFNVMGYLHEDLKDEAAYWTRPCPGM